MRSLRQMLAAVMDDGDLPDLGMRQLAMLVAVAAVARPCSVREIAAAIQAPPSTVSRGLDRLVAQGLMTRLRGPGGGKGWRMLATDKGMACVRRMTRAMTVPPDDGGLQAAD